ncbi:MAG: hypothetical protein AAF702_42920 [Chloroflexota bacterium]
MKYQQVDSIELQKVAALYSEGMTINNISRMLAHPEEDIKRLIEVAIERKYLKYEPVLIWETLDREVQELVYNESLTNTLSSALENNLECAIVPITITCSPTEMFTKYQKQMRDDADAADIYQKSELESIKVVAKRAADEISRLIFSKGEHILGINWGTLVSEVLKYIRPVPSELSGKLTIVSLFGDLDFHSPDNNIPSWLFARSEAVNCNSLVTKLVQRLGAGCEGILLNVPGFVPARFAQDERLFEQIREFMSSHYSYRQIFGGAPTNDPSMPRNIAETIGLDTEPKISEMDTIITGIGATDNYTLMHRYLNSLLNDKEIEILLKYCEDDLIIGDLAGHLVISEEGKEHALVPTFVQEINHRILAANPSDFCQVATRNRHTRKGAGVVVVAIGARKAKVIYTLLSQNPCPFSRLIIDSHCALALLNLIDPVAFKDYVQSKESMHFVQSSETWSRDTKTLIPV